jgi:hypothetical protein
VDHENFPGPFTDFCNFVSFLSLILNLLLFFSCYVSLDLSYTFAGSKGSNSTSSSSNGGAQGGSMAVPKAAGSGVSDSVLDADSSSTKSGRRPSVDTVSTYLSHESKDSELRASQVI